MAEPLPRDITGPEAVAAYKRMLAEIIDRRPSGTRQRLASALSKNRSFVSQITNPLYPTPVPASHIDLIFEVCHFSSAERRDFLRLYAKAHPKRAVTAGERRSTLAVHLPDLGDDGRNRKLQALVGDFVRQIVKLVDEDRQEKQGEGEAR